jgi:hypothetical protein
MINKPFNNIFMNKKLFPIASIVAMILLPSCLTSLHNLVTYKTVVSDDTITGNWQHDDLAVKIEGVPTSSFIKKLDSAKTDGGEKKSIYDSKEDSSLYSKSYLIQFAKNGYQYYMVCCLTRIGYDTYADLQPITAEPVDKRTASNIDDLFSAGGYTTTHSIAKLFLRGNQLELRILNGDFINDQLNNGTAAVRYERDDLFATTLITASSEQLREFLSKYGHDERLYSSRNTITLKKI